MQEYCGNRNRTNESYKKQESTEETSADSTPVGKLIAYKLLWYIPTYEYTGKETAYRKEYLTSNEVENVEEGLSANSEYVRLA